MRHLRDDGLAVKTHNHFHWTICGLCDWLVQRGKVIANPARRLDPVIAEGQERLPPAPLSEADVARLFALLPRRNAIDLRNRLQIELCYSCGLRLAETVLSRSVEVDVLSMRGLQLKWSLR